MPREHEQSDETKIALLQQQLDQMQKHIENTDAAVETLKRERDSALRWGLLTLGTATFTMVAWIWNFFFSRGGP